MLFVRPGVKFGDLCSGDAWAKPSGYIDCCERGDTGRVRKISHCLCRSLGEAAHP